MFSIIAACRTKSRSYLCIFQIIISCFCSSLFPRNLISTEDIFSGEMAPLIFCHRNYSSLLFTEDFFFQTELQHSESGLWLCNRKLFAARMRRSISAQVAAQLETQLGPKWASLDAAKQPWSRSCEDPHTARPAHRPAPCRARSAGRCAELMHAGVEPAARATV